MLNKFLTSLSKVLNENDNKLKGGRVFLPEYLKGKKGIKVISQSIEEVGNRFEFDVLQEFTNPFIKNRKEYGSQRMDFAFQEDSDFIAFVELESLDRSQLYVFKPNPDQNYKNDSSKLWYYFATLETGILQKEKLPKFFIFILILPNREVSPYQIWDVQSDCNLLDKSERVNIFQNPFSFYDHRIKDTARDFLTDNMAEVTKSWKPLLIKQRPLIEYQDKCELVFFTITIDEIILSRGKDAFASNKETKSNLKLSANTRLT